MIRDIYLYTKRELENIPAGSRVQLIDTKGIYYAVLYNNLWYGYYHYSLFIL